VLAVKTNTAEEVGRWRGRGVKRAIQPFHWGKVQLEARNERVCSVWLLKEVDENEVGISGYLRMSVPVEGRK